MKGNKGWNNLSEAPTYVKPLPRYVQADRKISRQNSEIINQTNNIHPITKLGVFFRKKLSNKIKFVFLCIN